MHICGIRYVKKTRINMYILFLQAKCCKYVVGGSKTSASTKLKRASLDIQCTGGLTITKYQLCYTSLEKDIFSLKNIFQQNHTYVHIFVLYGILVVYTFLYEKDTNFLPRKY